MEQPFKIIDYVKVYYERILIDNILYSRYFTHEGKNIGIPNGLSFYTKNQNAKYVRLTSTPTVSGMSIRYTCKTTQVNALLKLIRIQSLQQDNRPTADLRTNKRAESKQGINKSLPSGISILPRRIRNIEYQKVAVNVFNPDTLRHKTLYLYAGKVGDDNKLNEALNKAIEMRRVSMELTTSLTQPNVPKIV